MGSIIEINDTLKISKQRGFPKDLVLEDYIKDPKKYQDRLLNENLFGFSNEGERHYHQAPTRVFLVEEIQSEKWIYWGHVLILRQTITENRTDGAYKIVKLYDPDYQRQVTINESPQGKSYFDSAQQTP